MSVHLGRFALALLVLPCLMGCGLFEARSHHIEYCGMLGDGSQVVLSQERLTKFFSRGEDGQHAELYLYIFDSDGKEVWKGLAGKTGGTPSEPAVFDFEQLDGRRSADGMRLWILEHKQRRIVLALDRSNEQLYGLDDTPPDWAAPNLGVKLGDCGEE